MNAIIRTFLISILAGIPYLIPSDFLQTKAFVVANAIEYKVPYETSQIERFKELDLHALQVPIIYSSDISALVKYLIKPANNDIEKSRVIFRWIAENVSYDDHGYNTGTYADVSADGVFKNRVAVCDGFSNLFKKMGEIAGLEIVKISGYSKGYSYSQGSTFSDTNHAWNAIKIDGSWKLFDVTWAQGHGVTESGKLKSISQFDDFWFDTDPYAFIFTHLPEEPKWQLIENPISKRYYERLPYIQSSFFAMGFDGRTIFNQISSGTFSDLPQVYNTNSLVKITALPYKGTLRANETVKFILESTDATKMAAINNDKWTYFHQSGDFFTLEFSPEEGTLSISAKLDPLEASFSILVEYNVE